MTLPPETVARASVMLAELRANRFKLFAEAELVALGIPFRLRRDTQDEVLREKADRPFNILHTPPMSKEAAYYWEQRDCWCRESKGCYSYAKSRPQYRENLIKQILDYRDTCARLWAAVPDVDKLRFWDPNPRFRWACDYPTLAVDFSVYIDHTYAYWPEGLPEYRRQLKLLEWCLSGGS